MSKESTDEELDFDISKKFTLKKPIRGAILTVLYLCVLAVNMSSKIFPVASKTMKARMELSDIQYGSFGTLFQIGTFVSTVFLMFVFKEPDRKSTILTVLYLCGALLMVFRFVYTPIILMICQFLIGVCSMAINIYIVVWIDQFGMFFYKTVFLTLIGLFKSLGNVLTLLLNYYLGEENYPKLFMTASILTLSLAFILSFFRKEYFSSRIYLYKAKTYDDQQLLWKSKTGKDEPDSEDHGYDSIYRYRHSDASTADMTTPQIVWGLLTTRVYFMGLLASAVLTTASFGFNFWVIDYFNTVYGNVKPWDKLYTLVIISVAGPLGASVVNFVIALVIGGYHHKSTCLIMFFFYALATISGNLIPHLTNYAVIVVATSCFFLGSAAMTPYLQGTNFSGGTLSRKPFGILTANLWGLVFGGIPAPIFFAAINKYTNGDKVRTLSYFMKYLYIGLVFDFIMVIFKLSTFKKKAPAPKKDEKEIELKELN